eukprot:snap_masked-scaffold_37-processed-gene-1.2-mRNA-1 protein AED:0.12 eAED:0.16 QI:0/0/0.5/1/1/1/2/79/153
MDDITLYVLKYMAEYDLNGRYLTLFFLKGVGLEWFALDSVCYHTGGPLTLGDIEETPGDKKVVVCPWHKYKIDIQTGDKVYQGINVKTKETSWKTMQNVQATHTVTILADSVRITLNSDVNSFESNKYASNSLCGKLFSLSTDTSGIHSTINR